MVDTGIDTRHTHTDGIVPSVLIGNLLLLQDSASNFAFSKGHSKCLPWAFKNIYHLHTFSGKKKKRLRESNRQINKLNLSI